MKSTWKSYGRSQIEVSGIPIERVPQGTWVLWRVRPQGVTPRDFTTKKAAMEYAYAVANGRDEPLMWFDRGGSE